LRSFLFAPGNHARRVANALSLNADAVILDLEDAVATAEKRAACNAVVAALALARQPLLHVRVNAADTGPRGRHAGQACRRWGWRFLPST
jgi:citrate lyase subunit beta / citryl-CoA lyase